MCSGKISGRNEKIDKGNNKINQKPKNHNPNYTNLYEFANNPNKNSKLKSQKSKLQLKSENFNYLIVIASHALLLMITLNSK
jgi:hypothetical protein